MNLFNTGWLIFSKENGLNITHGVDRNIFIMVNFILKLIIIFFLVLVAKKVLRNALKLSEDQRKGVYGVSQ